MLVLHLHLCLFLTASSGVALVAVITTVREIGVLAQLGRRPSHLALTIRNGTYGDVQVGVRVQMLPHPHTVPQDDLVIVARQNSDVVCRTRTSIDGVQQGQLVAGATVRQGQVKGQHFHLQNGEGEVLSCRSQA